MPDCDEPLDILIELKGRKYMAHRIKADQLSVGDQVVVGLFIHKVLNISDEKNLLKLALKEYGVLKPKKSDFLTSIQGSGDYW